MKILLGNNTLSILAGSETHTYTLALALKKLGHEVTAFSPDLGFMAMKLSAEGIECVKAVGGEDRATPFNPVLQEKKDSFDVIICNHHDISVYLRGQFPHVPMIATIHGIIHKGAQGEIYPEHPAVSAGVDQFVAVSEEVQEILQKEYNLESVIIRNFFDLERFKNGPLLRPKPQNILVNSNYWGVDDQINRIIQDTAKILDCKLLGVGVNFVPTFEVEQVIKDVDIVFGMGRSVMEGAAMGKIAVVHGRWGTGGVINPESYERLKKTNFSGRGDTPPEPGTIGLWSPELIAKEILANYNQNNADAVHEIIAREHDAEIAAKRYLEIAEKLISKI